MKELPPRTPPSNHPSNGRVRGMEADLEALKAEVRQLRTRVAVLEGKRKRARGK